VSAAPLSATGLDGMLAHRLAVAGRLLRTHADAELSHLGVGGPALGVLLRLVEEDGLTQAALSRRQRVEAPSMCRMVDRLEREGLVERRSDPLDRRATHVHLSPAGRSLAGRGAAVVRDIERRAFGVLDDDERRQLGHLLGRVLGEMSPRGMGPS
jgi:DNA-binding MarR family transcriptional regulator